MLIEMHFDWADLQREDAFPLVDGLLTDDPTEATSKLVAWENLGEVQWHLLHIRRPHLDTRKALAAPSDRIPGKWWDIISKYLARPGYALHVMGTWGEDMVCVSILTAAEEQAA